MRQNIISACLQTGSSLVIAALSIGIFRLLNPEQMAFIRQHYFVPFAIITALAPANQNYLRSILFAGRTDQAVWLETRALVIVQVLGGLTLLATIVFALDTSGGLVSPLNSAALLLALMLAFLRTLVTGLLEFNHRYSMSILLNNFGAMVPYIAVFAILLQSNLNGFFYGVIALNVVSILMTGYFAGPLKRLVSFPVQTFEFRFNRYLSLSIIAMGSVVVYQGIEFCLYNYTNYPDVDISNYALAFSASAVVRQIVISAIQPLEHERHYRSRIGIGRFGSLSRPICMELIIYVVLMTSVLVFPWAFGRVFPKYESASLFITPLVLGVLGSSIQQIYSVRMIAQARTKFLSISQIALAVSSVLVVLFLNKHMNLIALTWILSAFIWVRGCIIIPLYAERLNREHSVLIWLLRLTLSSLLFCVAL